MSRSVILVVVAAGWLAHGEARTYQCSRVPPSGPSLYWSARTIPYVLHAEGDPRIADGSDLEAARQSFATWEAVTCSDLAFDEQPLTQERLAGYDWRAPDANENLIVWRAGRADDPADGWRHERGSIAVATTTFKSRTGELLDADIELNAVVYDFTTCTPPAPGCTVLYDVQNTLTHEIGHVLGLDHPPLTQSGVTETTMYPSAPRGELKKRDLDADDEAGLCFLYPDGAPARQCYPATPAGGPEPLITQVGSDPDTGCLCRGDRARAGSWPALLILLLAVRRRLH